MSPAGEPIDPLGALTGYQGSAILGTVVELGVADAMAAGPIDAERLSSELSLDPRATAYLLGAMTALGLAERADGGLALSAAGRQLVSARGSIAEIVRKEWFFYRVWAGLPEAIRDGHARIPAWRRRLEDDPSQSLNFLRALDDLAARFGAGLPELAGLEDGGTLLDAGGGAGSHSAYLAEAVEGLRPTVLDLPAAEPILNERHPGIPFVAGDLEQERFGRPEDETWDYVLLANILHDHPPARCREIVAEAAKLLAPGGRLLIYEWVLGQEPGEPPDVAVFSLMMLVENEGGGTWTEADLQAWTRAAGLEPGPLRRSAGPISVLTAQKPRVG